MFDLLTLPRSPYTAFCTRLRTYYREVEETVAWGTERFGEGSNFQMKYWGVRLEQIRLEGDEVWWHGHYATDFELYPHTKHYSQTVRERRLFVFRHPEAAFEFRLRWC